MSEIIIGRGLLARAGRLSAELLGAGSAAIIADDAVDALYAGALEASLADAGWRVFRRAFPRGEASKTLATYGELLGFLADSRLSRSDAVFALGGGVTGDLAGFAAASYLRGVKLVQLPTTLLACVDSSVGGKTAIDLPHGKNLAGAFYMPHMVLIDPDLLATLPEATLREGAAEVVKYAAIGDAALLPLALDPRGSAETLIRRCVAIKSEIVARDERDEGARQILNFGHTFGHAVERLSGYRLSHGASVAVGMSAMARACANMGLCRASDAAALTDALAALGLPLAADFDAEDVLALVGSDKKRNGSHITLVALRSLGRCELINAPLSQARAFLEAGWRAW